MRASRLLRILLILQNRGRQTARQLADDLEVAPRTILRDVDAMTEAGLPIIVHQGNQGGIELGFNYRARLTGLSRTEAEALAVQIAAPRMEVLSLGLGPAFETARAKLMESLPDTTRGHCEETSRRFTADTPKVAPNPYLVALAVAVREKRILRLRARSNAPQECHPVRLHLDNRWALFDARAPDRPIYEDQWGDLNISARRFA